MYHSAESNGIIAQHPDDFWYNHPMRNLPRVSIYLMNAYSTHQQMLRGVLAYTRGHTPWAIDLKTGRRDEANLADIAWEECDGLITNGVTPEILRRIREHGLPVVLVQSEPRPDFPGCVLFCDNGPIAETAARHLLARDCAAYAFVHVPDMSWSRARGGGFAAAVQAVGASCLRWTAGSRRTLARQIAAAPKPLGVFAADDVRARETLDACREAGCAVPDDVLILGVDDDETLCELSAPPLSSIPLSSQEAGYRAAEILDRALRGDLRPDGMQSVFYTGTRVTERASTALPRTRDALVRRCRDLLAANFAGRLRVPDLARQLGVSRRTLETRFHAVTGTTITAEILRLRLDHAQILLAQPELSQEKVALACGFCDASHLGAAFRRHVGKPPSAFRGASTAAQPAPTPPASGRSGGRRT